MDGECRLIGKGSQAFRMNRSEKSGCLAIQEDKPDHLPLNGYRRADTRAQPICCLQPLPTRIRVGVIYDHSLSCLKHLPQIVRFSQRKFNPHNFKVEATFIVTIRADNVGRVSLDKHDCSGIMRYNTPSGGENMIQDL